MQRKCSITLVITLDFLLKLILWYTTQVPVYINMRYISMSNYEYFLLNSAMVVVLTRPRGPILCESQLGALRIYGTYNLNTTWDSKPC